MTEHYAIGIDVGGTKIAAGLVAFPAAQVLAKEIIPTLPEREGSAVLQDALGLAERLKSQAEQRGLRVSGIGVAIAELVNIEGEITSNTLIKWRDLSARQAFSTIAPTRFESDARAPAMAEGRFGAGVPYHNFIYLTIGTGISYCLVLDGKPYLGAHGNAIIAGSGILSSKCEACGAKTAGNLETFAAGPALVTRYNGHTGAALITGQQVTAAAAAGDKAAQHVVRSAGEAVGNTVGFLINALDPQAVIVAGGLGLASGLFWESFLDSTRQRIWAEDSQQLPLVHAQLGLDAGLIGAALIGAALVGAAWVAPP